ncbi:MAG: DUF4276 family protein [Planctomycetes bacterium]|nr:DUF4276 family protein [Planctomycetota bacterium]
MKFVLFVEGDMEQAVLPPFLKRYLDPKLKQRINVTAVRFHGWRHLIDESPTKALMHLNNPRGSAGIIAVIALLDLYGPTFYPPDKRTADARHDWAKRYLEREANRKVKDHRFHQFFAVHEIEAWLLSDPTILPSQIQTALPGRIQHPEQVNFDEPPKKLLTRLYRERGLGTYKPTVQGKDLFARLDPNVACVKCPRLQQMLDTMLDLARQAGL